MAIVGMFPAALVQTIYFLFDRLLTPLCFMFVSLACMVGAASFIMYMIMNVDHGWTFIGAFCLGVAFCLALIWLMSTKEVVKAPEPDVVPGHFRRRTGRGSPRRGRREPPVSNLVDKVE